MADQYIIFIKNFGYNCIGINHLGDWGTQFGKLIEGYKRWGNEYNIDENPIDELTKIYVRINTLCKEDETVLDACRDNFKKLEDGSKYENEIWEKIRTLSLVEFQKIYDLINVKFDSLNGEAFYVDKMQEVKDILEKKNILQESEGALVVPMKDENMAPLIIGKTNGSTTYATRDLAAILYRSRTYDYDKSIYVTSYEQIFHFKQLFEVAEYLGIDQKYVDGLEHVPFGMVQLKSGKMSTREGNIIKLEDILNESIKRVEKIISEKNPELENKEEIAKKIGIGAVIFGDLYNNRIKDEIFDWDEILNFSGETGPYIQYTYVRTKSVLEKAGYIPKINEIDYNVFDDKDSFELVKLIYNFSNILIQAANKSEPSIISRYIIDIAQSYSAFYNNNKILNDDKNIEKARIYLTYITGLILKVGVEILGIEMPEAM